MTNRDRRRELANLRLHQQQQGMIDTRAEFHSLEDEIQRLCREYTRFEPLAIDRDSMRRGLRVLQEDQALLSQWMNRLRVPNWEDIQMMKTRLAAVNTRFKDEERRQRDPYG